VGKNGMTHKDVCCKHTFHAFPLQIIRQFHISPEKPLLQFAQTLSVVATQLLMLI
jgi:hypothetical protein